MLAKRTLKIDHHQKMNEDNRIKIIELKEKIHDLTEYLQSDMCRSCGDIALKIEKYIQELSDLVLEIKNNECS